ncbi:MAG: HEAT repeat domain-containing protein [Candidatus Methanoperedens sp.]|nr:HEAT repeat domain-containing protein [Candidatus Methanoperedens sp.]
MVTEPEIHRMMKSGNVYDRIVALHELKKKFSTLTDKDQATKDMLTLTKDKESSVRKTAAEALGFAFAHITDKDQAWKDMLALTKDENWDVRSVSAEALDSAFVHLTDKDQATKDLLTLTKDENWDVRSGVAYALGSAFVHLTDKDQATKDLLTLTRDKNWDVRSGVAYALGSAFVHLTNKDQATKELLTLTKDKDSFVRRNAAEALGSAFAHITDKDHAWNDLLALTKDENWDVRKTAAEALGSTFVHVTDKDQATKDLLTLTKDENWNVRSGVAYALGSAFADLTDRDQAAKDLLSLTNDKYSIVRAYANHSLGRVHIYKATEAEDIEKFRKELENALKFFEKSSNEEIYSQPARFCLPFYRSFHATIFEKDNAEAKVQEYLNEARSAVGSSEGREKLLVAVENLGNALKEAQKARDFNDEKSDLKAYRRYCERASELLEITGEKAPNATRLIMKSLPIIDNRIKNILPEIRDKAIAIYNHTKDTPLMDIGMRTCRQAQELSLKNPVGLEIGLGRIINTAKEWCEHIGYEGKKKSACEKLKSLENLETQEKVIIISEIFEDISKNLNIPRIETVHICGTQEKLVRIAVIQFCYELTKSFPPVIKNKDMVKAKIFSGLDMAKKDNANIACLPELCLCEEWKPEIENNYPEMLVICGGFYKNNSNVCPIITKSDIEIVPQAKITPSASEDKEMWENGMIPGDRIYKYETRFGKFVILICRDFDRFAHYFRESDIDFIFCPAFNEANDRFHAEANNHVTKKPSYILIANTGVYGGSAIFGQVHKNYFNRLIGDGCKDDGDMSFKLCEAKKGKDEIIIADFNLTIKTIGPINPSVPLEPSVKRIKKLPIS